jgi:murein DD-endopeptidase MepM/ murein hydrolase activator NlpD
MKLRFPLDKHIELSSIPAANRWGAVRKYDRHTGVDLFCDPGTPVYAIEDGIVTKVAWFTGEIINLPWWENTQAVAVEGKSGVWNYAELTPNEPFIRVGKKIYQGDIIGYVKTVLKKDKGLPMTMLHLELYKKGYRGDWVSWQHNYAAPADLMNPEFIFGQKEYNKLTSEAKPVADHNGWITDEQIKEAVKEFKITARLEWDIPASQYAKWKPSDFFTAMVDHNKRDPIVGSGEDSGIGGSMVY